MDDEDFEDDIDDEFKLRSDDELLDAIVILIDQVWYARHQSLREADTDPEVWHAARAAAKLVEAKIADLGPWSDFEWGMICGKLSALRWMAGDPWDNLDT